MWANYQVLRIPFFAQGLRVRLVLEHPHAKHQHFVGFYDSSDNALGEPCLPVSGVLYLEEEGIGPCASGGLEEV